MKRKLARLLGLFFALFCIPYSRKVSSKELELFNGLGTHIILTRTKWCLTNLFIRGKYKHAAIINSDCTHVVEAVTHGVRKTNLTKFLSSKHNYLVIKPYRMTIREANIIEATMYQYIGRPYDWLFFWETDSFYCSELVATIFNTIRPNFFNTSDRILQPSELLAANIEEVLCKQ